MSALNDIPDVRQHSAWRIKLELKGIELHLDTLMAYYEAGFLPDMNDDDLVVVDKLSKLVGGYCDAFDSPAAAQSYRELTIRMANTLGAFYHQQEKQSE